MIVINKAPLRTAPKQHLDKNYIKNLARGRWPHILNYFGIDLSYLKNKHGPCPICGGKDRYRYDDKHGDGTFYCTHCSAGDGFKLLQLHLGCNFHEALYKVGILVGTRADIDYSSEPQHIRQTISDAIENEYYEIAKNPQRKRELLNLIWKQGKSVVNDDPVDRYFKARRIVLTQFSSALRFHPGLDYYDGKQLIGTFPAMIALVTDENSCGVTIHRTYLGDACKADVEKPKKLMSPVREGATRGASIKLYKPENREIVVAEGIETALALHFSAQVSVWATLSANGMEQVIIPSSITKVIIAVDNDENLVGQKAAEKLAKRLKAEGRKVTRVIPNKVGSDFADILVGGV